MPVHIQPAGGSTKDAVAHGSRLLATLNPDRVITPESPAYDEARNGYWCREQIKARPGCFYQPRTAADVSLALVALQHANCPFAVKAGGHGKFVGESSIEDGVAIDLKRLNHVKLSDDRRTVEVGPGSNWLEVYSVLEPLGLTVVGGRAAGVGVGGFVLGGGISFYSNLYGWALDNVESFEVVLATGQIVSASSTANPDLYKSLRGGGGNFGIVTSLKLMVYPYAGMWGGGRGYEYKQRDALLSAFWDYGYNLVENAKMSYILTLSHREGRWVWGSDLVYLEPEVPTTKPIFKDILNIPAVYDTTAVTSHTKRAKQMGSHFPEGVYNVFWTFCTQVDRRIVEFYFDTWIEETKDLVDMNGQRSLLADCQFITATVSDAMSRNGGNALGLAGKGPFLMMLMQPWWQDASQTPDVFRALRNTYKKVTDEATKLGVHHAYVYSNYACQFQDPYGGYGLGAKEFLEETAGRYDPNGVFQRLRKSGFNFDGAPQRFRPDERL